jgi:hypothetical protein
LVEVTERYRQESHYAGPYADYRQDDFPMIILWILNDDVEAGQYPGTGVAWWFYATIHGKNIKHQTHRVKGSFQRQETPILF